MDIIGMQSDVKNNISWWWRPEDCDIRGISLTILLLQNMYPLCSYYALIAKLPCQRAQIVLSLFKWMSRNEWITLQCHKSKTYIKERPPRQQDSVNNGIHHKNVRFTFKVRNLIGKNDTRIPQYYPNNNHNYENFININISAKRRKSLLPPTPWVGCIIYSMVSWKYSHVPFKLPCWRLLFVAWMADEWWLNDNHPHIQVIYAFMYIVHCKLGSAIKCPLLWRFYMWNRTVKCGVLERDEYRGGWSEFSWINR